MRTVILLIVAVLASAGVGAQQIAVDRETVARIRAEGLDHSQVEPVFNELTINIGPRLTASPAHKRAVEYPRERPPPGGAADARAVEYTRERLAAYGLSNVHVEPWKFGRGWNLEKLTVEMIEPRYLPLIG